MAIGAIGALSVAVNSVTVTLTWGSATGVTGYHVQHSLAPMGNFSSVATVTSVTHTISYTASADQQISHYYRVIGYNADGNSEPTNVVTATPNKQGEENIYKYVTNQLISLLKNDSRLNIVEDWQEEEPDKCMSFRRVTGWVFFAGADGDWAAIGEREERINIIIGYNIKEPTRTERWNSNSVTEPKDLLYQTKEVLYDYIDLIDYCYDMEIRDRRIVPNVDGTTSRVMISTVWKKRIRR